MAEWEYEPHQPSMVFGADGPIVLKTRLEDGTWNRREKSSTEKRRVRQVFRENATLTDAKLDIYDSKGELTTLTIISYDPQAATPSTDEWTVYFASNPRNSSRRVGPNLYETTYDFEES